MTGARTTEPREATHTEIDRKAKVWTIPAGRMKAGREHRVPLTDEALALLDSDPADSKYLFPSPSGLRALQHGDAAASARSSR